MDKTILYRVIRVYFTIPLYRNNTNFLQYKKLQRNINHLIKMSSYVVTKEIGKRALSHAIVREMSLRQLGYLIAVINMTPSVLKTAFFKKKKGNARKIIRFSDNPTRPRK